MLLLVWEADETINFKKVVICFLAVANIYLLASRNISRGSILKAFGLIIIRPLHLGIKTVVEEIAIRDHGVVFEIYFFSAEASAHAS